MREEILTLAALAALLAGPGCDADRDGRPTPPIDEPTDPGTEPPAVPPPSGDVRARTVYVPAYSHLEVGEGERRLLLAITLSVHNVNPTATVTLTHVDYYDTAGRRVRRYLARPRALRPLETAEFSVHTLDEAGGSGANFLVHWEGPGDAHPLLTETIMFGHVGTGYVSFTSRGVELAQPPELNDDEGTEDAAPEAPPAPTPGD